MDKKETETVIVSPLEKWPGNITLPLADDFDGKHWQAWRKAVSVTNESVEEVNRLFAYAGAQFIGKFGGWQIQGVSLEVFQSWQNSPELERVRFVSWVGKAMRDYMNEITNPKD
jgi:hypothetical protein